MVKKKKLLVVTTTFPRWENDTDPPFVYELSKRLTESFDVYVHTPHYPSSTGRETISDLKVVRFRYFFKRFEKLAGQSAIVPFLKKHKSYYLILPFFLMFQFSSLFFLVRKIKPDVIHAHWLIPNGFFAVLSGRILGNVPVVVTAHGADLFSMRNLLLQYVKKVVLQRSKRVVVVSNALYHEARKICSSCNINKISMGVDGRRFTPQVCYPGTIRQDGKSVSSLLFVGRLSEKKGVDYLLEAMALVVQQKNETTLIIVGSGEQEDNLRRMVRELNLEQHVVFTGAVPNDQLPLYYASADIFVGPSIIAKGGDAEGFGLTFVEAAMAGCFLIGTRTGGIEDIIEHGRTGLLIEPASSRELADGIIWVLDNWEICSDWRKKGRERCLKLYDWEVVASQYEELLLE